MYLQVVTNNKWSQHLSWNFGPCIFPLFEWYRQRKAVPPSVNSYSGRLVERRLQTATNWASEKWAVDSFSANEKNTIRACGQQEAKGLLVDHPGGRE